MDGCYYTTMWGQAFAWTQLLPSAVSLVLTVLTFVTSQLIFLFLGWYLHGVQLILWAIQLNLAIDRPNPLCQEYHSFAFPSIEAYYIGAVVAFIVAYSVRWKVHQPWYMWGLLLAFFVAPSGVLVFLAYNTWYEVAISLAIGVVASVLFVLVLWVYVYDTIPFVLHLFPLQAFHYKDSYIFSGKKAYARKAREIERALAQVKV